MRSLATHTFLFADLAGFTALTDAHGDEQAARTAADFYQRVREVLPGHSEVVKEIGDAVMIRCDNASDAVRMALRLVHEVGVEHGFPTVRVGMHTGPAVERGGDWFGAAVNVAARVANLAAGGEVLLTDQTRRAATSLEGIDLRERGRHELKNVAKPLAFYVALRAGERTPAGLAVDPVCRMTIESGREEATLVHEGVEYRFCSLDCVQSFVADPDCFIHRGPRD